MADVFMKLKRYYLSLISKLPLSTVCFAVLSSFDVKLMKDKNVWFMLCQKIMEAVMYSDESTGSSLS
ncbi:hypothetical protein EGR_10482 [Echinococcus granulosus]|uniref:Uncharacterized protein n=1 Tax=Echinococcus granulosus TaxID=6210 RepID=W6UMF0_ECHGR|nr:hypothetical protein EGR_10482 [Echinococcus granulosus]EUB54664.1 hypothetical protein EGR_10482 [Echinococcus granulosus]